MYLMKIFFVFRSFQIVSFLLTEMENCTVINIDRPFFFAVLDLERIYFGGHITNTSNFLTWGLYAFTNLHKCLQIQKYKLFMYEYVSTGN